jgi:glycerol-3-phosphate dehydrogenase
MKVLQLTNFVYLSLDSPTEVTHNPLPKEEEIQWILNEVEHYLSPGKFY